MLQRPAVWVFAHRCRTSCSTFVGRPRGLVGGGGSAGRVDRIHSWTSCSYQHSRRLFGSLNGRGIKCAYLAFVAQVRIVVAVFPIKADSCSIKMVLGGAGGTWGKVVCMSISQAKALVRAGAVDAATRAYGFLPGSHGHLLPHLTVPLFTEAWCRGYCACNPNNSTLAGTRRALMALSIRLSLIPRTSPTPSQRLTQRQHGCPAGSLCCSHPCMGVSIKSERRSSASAALGVITITNKLGTILGQQRPKVYLNRH